MRRDPAEQLARTLREAVHDDRVLEAIAATPRAPFVPRRLRARAYDNEPLPIGGGQTISQPLVVARMAELLDVRPGDRVLDVGTGSGRHDALLARLGGVRAGAGGGPRLWAPAGPRRAERRARRRAVGHGGAGAARRGRRGRRAARRGRVRRRPGPSPV